MSSDVWGSLYKYVTSSFYLSSFFRLSTVAGIRTMTLHRISSPPCVIGESRYCVDVNCTSISAPLSSKYFVIRLIYCGRSPTAPGSWLEHVLITKISNGFPLSQVTFQYFILLRWPISAIVMVALYGTIKLAIHFGTDLV